MPMRMRGSVVDGGSAPGVGSEAGTVVVTAAVLVVVATPGVSDVPGASRRLARRRCSRRHRGRRGGRRLALSLDVVATVVAGAVVVSSVGAVVAIVVAGAVVVSSVGASRRHRGCRGGRRRPRRHRRGVCWTVGQVDRRGDAPCEKDEQQGEAENPDGRLHGNDYYCCRYLKHFKPRRIFILCPIALILCMRMREFLSPPGVCGRRCPGRSAQRDRGSDRLGRVRIPPLSPVNQYNADPGGVLIPI